MAKIIDGKRIAAETRARIRKDTEHFIARTGITPGLAVIIVGDRRCMCGIKRGRARKRA